MHRIRRVALLALVPLLSVTVLAAPPSSHTVVTLAGNGRNEHAGDGGPATRAGVGGPFGLAIGPDDALYVCETTTHVVRRIDLETGVATTVAGTGEKGYDGDGGPATKARLNEPYEVRFDTDGNMFFVEMRNNIVRRVDRKTGRISTVAGTGEPGFSGDGGPAIKARFKSPHSIEIVGNDLYVCDIGNHRVRRVDLESGRVETVLGDGRKVDTPDGAPFTKKTPVKGPRALAYDPKTRGKSGPSLWLALREGNAVYRIDLRTKTLHHVAGTGKKGYAGHGGPAKKALLSGPKGISVDPKTGDVYLADTESHTVRVIRLADHTIHTVCGDGTRGNGPDGDPLRCRTDRLHGVFVDGKRRAVYIGDSNNNVVRRLSID